MDCSERYATIVRDSLYDRIPLTAAEVALIGTPTFQRLDRIQQLGFVSKVWPGAKHTRYEHSLGVLHLMRQALTTLRRHSAPLVDDQAARTALAAALLHDVGHYPFSHAIEELGPPVLPHEEVGRRLIEGSELADVLEREWRVDPGRVANLIAPREPLAPADRLLRGLLSGALDVDKLDYLPRDARHCNVPYGGVDTPRLLDALRVAEVHGVPRIVVTGKGVSPLHSLINARQEMFDNVYWHHANRAAMAMLQRAVQDALLAGALRAEELPRHDDASLLARLSDVRMPESTRQLVGRLRDRILHKRALEVSARAPDLYRYLSGLYGRPAARRELELELARRLGELLGEPVADWEVLLAIPKPEKWSTDVWVLYERPPLGYQRLMPWQDVVGLTDSDFARFEEHRRLIRVVTTARLRDAVAEHWPRLLLPLLR
ncbi:MAG: HD domain-containing protein [Thermomicrobium sp.]|nr:HD domain-containing protein [Thermomicrobium sp.]